jgi:O-antigen ligase
MGRPQAGYSRIALGLVLLAAAAPWRYFGSFPLVASVSVLDGAVLVAAVVLLARRAMVHDMDIGDRWATILVGVLPLLSVTSLMWTTDVPATIRETVSYGEAFLAYVFAVQQTRGLPADRIVRMLRRFLYLLLIPPILMLLHVPGFEPQQVGVKLSSGDYLSYFSRLSHPFTGRSNNLATILLMLCVVLVYWALTHRDIATYVAALVCVTAIVLTISRGALLALLVAALLAVLLPHGQKIRRRPGPLVVAVVSGVLLAALTWAFYVSNPATREFLTGRLSLDNVTGRQQRFSTGVGYLLQRPFLGWGAGTLPGGDAIIQGGVHNTYLQQLLAYGMVLGFIGVLSLIALAAHFLWRQRPGTRRAVGLTLVALLINFAVESSFEGAVLRVIIYLLLGMLVGLTGADDVRAREQLSAGGPTAERRPLPALQQQ